jgi:hypothetical protein
LRKKEAPVSGLQEDAQVQCRAGGSDVGDADLDVDFDLDLDVDLDGDDDVYGPIESSAMRSITCALGGT